MKAVALFAGCGGLARGFKNAGYDIVAAFDNWWAATNIFKKNFPESQVFCCDLKTAHGNLDVFTQFDPDIIIGGPPCQDYSHSGKRDEELGRADLTVTFAEIVRWVRPEWFVMENVDQIQKSQRLKQAQEILKNAGYGLTSRILTAGYCGVPQIRKRYFLIGHVSAIDGFLDTYLLANLSKNPLTVREYLGDTLDINHYYRHPRNYGRRAIFSINEPSPTIRGVNRPIPKSYKGHPRDSAPLSPELRPLTTFERSLLQTFPKDYIFEGSKTDLEQMIGNAVPVKLAEYVAKCIITFKKESLLEKQLELISKDTV